VKHARDDYDRIQDPAGLIPEEEPVFLIRGQDACAPATLRFWAREAMMKGADRAIIDLVREHADAMEQWQAEHGGKVPDLP